MSGYKKKLIEVALPLEAINKEAAREKSIRHGHPSTLHLYWARRPLAACRAVLFAQLVDDPSAHPDQFPTEEAQEKERRRLFDIIEELVLWENSTNEAVLERARAEIRRSCDGNPPPVLDPFCGGGSIPLEAQRLGLEAHGSDLNPVAVLITKALIEIPPKFAGQAPVHPGQETDLIEKRWKGAEGLAEDVRYYGEWMRSEAEKAIGHLYPKVKLSKELGGGEATVIAWIWARTVKCPNPACGAEMPLVRSFDLSTRKGKKAWIEPVTAGKRIEFQVTTGSGKGPPGTVERTGAKCIFCDGPVPFDYVRSEGREGRMSTVLMAVVAEGKKGRVYSAPDSIQIEMSKIDEPTDAPDTDLPEKALGFRVQAYGMVKHKHLFTPRQLVALTTFCDLVQKTRERVLADARHAGLVDDKKGLEDSGVGAQAYADAVATYLGLATSRTANTVCSLAVWSQGREQSVNVFSRQALPMNWDFPEVNPFAGAAGDFGKTCLSMARTLGLMSSENVAFVTHRDSTIAVSGAEKMVIATDPPYYDNIGYADLSDFFYIWLRRALGNVYCNVTSTLLTPKKQELIATPYRFDGEKEKARKHFETGLARTFCHMKSIGNPMFPVTIYYAFKQAETEKSGGSSTTSSTGWETMLTGLIEAGFAVLGTWPLRTERPTGVKASINALASSIVLVCRARPEDAPLATRKEFLNRLKKDLADSLVTLKKENIAPVDLAQAAIGPGMAVFSSYSKVLEADGTAMSVRTALGIINEALDELLSEEEGEYDADTRWALAWYQEFGKNPGEYGRAETLATAKNVAVDGLVEAGILSSRGGKVRILKRDELLADWDPLTDKRLTVWEITHYLIRDLEKQGEPGAAAILRKVGGKGEAARDLAYRLYTIAERKSWADDALAYNSLVVAWPEIQRLASESASTTGPSGEQMKML